MSSASLLMRNVSKNEMGFVDEESIGLIEVKSSYSILCNFEQLVSMGEGGVKEERQRLT